MTTYLSSLLTNTTSKYTSLRRSLLSDSTEETDGDTEDDSHIARALRAYYIEKGRSFPTWLPPDPRAARKQAALLAQQQNAIAAEGARYAQGGYAQPAYGGGAGRQPGAPPMRSGGLGDLFGDGERGRAQQQQQQPASLRRGVSGGSAASGRSNYFAGGGVGMQDAQGRLTPQPGLQQAVQQQQQQQQQQSQPMGRPLPSQRQGSYQTQSLRGSGGASARPEAPGGGGGGEYGAAPGGYGGQGGAAPTAQDRLKQRLWGARGGASGGGLGGR